MTGRSRAPGLLVALLATLAVVISGAAWFATGWINGGPPSGHRPIPASAAPTTSVGVATSTSEAPGVITVAFNGRRMVFDRLISCAIGPDGRGTIRGTAADGTTFSALLDRSEPAVAIAGSSGTAVALITSAATTGPVLHLEADPPGIDVYIVLVRCVALT